jgi:thiamine biosynthesis lipoprotein
MGSRVHLIAVGAPARVLERARALVERLERLWSRFRPDSEVARLNAAGGMPFVVSPETFAVVSHAVDAWDATGGRFDPTVLTAVVRAGYDRDFEALVESSPPAGEPVPAPGCAGIVLDERTRSVTLPSGVQLDLGGIGKGLAADLVVADLLANGAEGACANVGGDVRVKGEAPGGGGWAVAIEHPLFHGDEVTRIVLSSGGVASSSRVVRAWTRDGRSYHHLIDPARGTPAWTGLAGVTVVAGEAWWAEGLAKAAFVAGAAAGADLINSTGSTGLMIDDAGTAYLLPGLEVHGV